MYTLNFFTLPGLLAVITMFLVVGQLILTFVFSGDTDIDVDGGDGGFDVSSVNTLKDNIPGVGGLFGLVDSWEKKQLKKQYSDSTDDQDKTQPDPAEPENSK